MLSWIAQGFTNVVNAITSALSDVGEFFTNLFTYLGDFFSFLFESLGNWFGDIGTWFTDLGSSIGGFFSDLFSTLGNLLSYLNPFDENFFGYKLIELIGDLLEFLFVPSSDIVTNLQNSVSSKFGFIDSIKIAISDIQNMISNIQNGTSKFTFNIDSEYYSGEVVLFDLSWYVPFKTYGDLVFTGFAYVFFVFRLYKAIPSIIHGFSSFSGGAD